MTLENFNVEDVGPIKKAQCRNVPNPLIIAGPNGVGKSTLLEHLRKQLRTAESSNHVDTKNPQKNTKVVYFSPHRGPVDASFNAQDLMAFERISIEDQLSGTNYNLRIQDGMSINGTPRELRVNQNEYRSRNKVDFAPYYEFQRQMNIYKYDEKKLAHELLKKQNKVTNEDIPDYEEPLRKAIREVLPGIEYDGVREEEGEYNIFFEDRSGEIVEFNELSSGEKDLVAMVFLLVEREMENIFDYETAKRNPGDVILMIDGPETYLHPGMQRRFFEYVTDYLSKKDSPPHVIMCTHSKTLIENTDPDNLHFLLYQDQRTENQLVSSNRISTKVLNRLTGELGVTALSSGNPLLLVEGKMDREILSLIYPELNEKFEILPMQGKNKVLGISKALNKIIPEIRSAGIYLFAIVDGDRNLNLDQDIEEYVYKLDANCLENLLLDEEAIFESLKSLAGTTKLEKKDINDPNEIWDLIENIINRQSFQEHMIHKRLNEKLIISINTRAIDDITSEGIESKIDKEAQKRKEQLSELITDIKEHTTELVENEKLRFLDGKRIISQIAAEFDERTDRLSRVLADKIRGMNNQPSNLSRYIQNIKERVLGR